MRDTAATDPRAVLSLEQGLMILYVFLIAQSKAENLDDKPNNLDELKLVLRTISNIRDVSLDIETGIRDVIERYRLLDMYNLLVSRTGQVCQK